MKQNRDVRGREAIQQDDLIVEALVELNTPVSLVKESGKRSQPIASNPAVVLCSCVHTTHLAASPPRAKHPHNTNHDSKGRQADFGGLVSSSHGQFTDH